MSSTYLITGIGGDIAQNVALILRQVRPGARLVGTDLHSRHGGALLVDTTAIVPHASSPDYTPALGRIIDAQEVDAVFPMTEPELRSFVDCDDWEGDTTWISAGRPAITVGLDKLETIRMLERLGLPVPWTIDAKCGMPKQYPCIFKPRRGSGSRAVFTVRDDAEAKFLSHRYPRSVFQQLLEPPEQEVTCGVYRSLAGEVLVLQLRRRLIGGFTGWAEVVSLPEVEHMCVLIANELEVSGCLNVQLRITSDGPRVFEINPRISSTALIRHLMGFEDVRWALDEVEGVEPSFRLPEVGRTAVKTFGAALIE